MYWKVLKNGKVIDVLDNLVFVKHQKKHDLMLLCDKNEANAIQSSDGKSFWYEKSLEPLDYKQFDIVHIEEIDQYEYEQLRNMHCKTYQEIIDEYTLLLIKGGII